jgi:uncharacterized protein YbaA (DUF1428 family)
MSYVDVFVCAVPDANREIYRAHAHEAGLKFKEFGATQVMECWAEDVPDGKLTSFPMAVKCQPGESVVFAWVVWPSKDVREAAWTRMMDDERMSVEAMPFDGKRLIYGGFTPIVTL